MQFIRKKLIMSENGIIKVAHLNEYIKSIFEHNDVLQNIRVEGEISNFKRHASSGHCYFSIKDDKAAIRCVMFRSAAERMRTLPKNGQAVIVQGSISVYTKTGDYQLYVNRLMPVGIGDLQVQYEQLKEKLAQEGVFKDESKRRHLPETPRKIGIVTSSTGAVIRDMVRVLKRRWPMVEVLLVTASVQGTDGARSIVYGLRTLYKRSDIDVIIVGRGGGSLEDLWNFNEEPVVRTISESPVPIISAVGHETDVTLSDFAADVRAGTPSIAAEIAVPDWQLVYQKLNESKEYANKCIKTIVSHKRDILNGYFSSGVLQDSSKILAMYSLPLDQRCTELENSMKMYMSGKEKSFAERVAQLDALSPLKVLGRGFSYCEKNQHAITSVNQVAVGDLITLKFMDGQVESEVKEIQ